MANHDVILRFLKDKGGMYCDDCLSKLCNVTPRQQVNQICNRSSDIRRIEDGVCASCHSQKICRGAMKHNECEKEIVKTNEFDNDKKQFVAEGYIGLERRVENAINEMKTFNYVPEVFMNMISKYGTLKAMEKLVKTDIDKPQYGFKRLKEAGRLDLTMESIMLEDAYKCLFTKEELDAAHWRLDNAKKEQYGIGTFK